MRIFHFIFTAFIFCKGFSQPKTDDVFFWQSQSSQHLDPNSTMPQIIALEFDQLTLNKICDLEHHTLVIRESGLYSLSGYVCVNPGMNPKKTDDFITLHVSFIASGNEFITNQVLTAQTQSYMYGNLSVAEQIQLPERIAFLEKGVKLRLYVQRMPYSTLPLNENPYYYHIDPPTGMRYSMALRIEKK